METVAIGATNDWAPLATLTVGVVAFAGVVLGVVQKWRADRREHWWQRTQWALQQLKEDEETRAVGLLIFEAQLDSQLATKEDAELAKTVAELILGKP